MAKSRCDYIQLRNVQLPVPVYLQTDAWRRTNKPQPATFSVRISYPAALISLAAENDTVGHTLNYGTLYRSIESAIISSNKDAVSDENAGDPSIGPSHNRDIVDVALTISDAAHKVLWSEIGATERGQDDAIFLDSWFTEKKEEITVDLHLPKAILRAERGLFCTLVTRKRPTKEEDSFMDFDLTVRIEGIRCACIIGVNPHEREDKQIVELALTFQQSRGKARMIPKEYQTMVSKVAEVSLLHFEVDSCTYDYTDINAAT